MAGRYTGDFPEADRRAARTRATVRKWLQERGLPIPAAAKEGYVSPVLDDIDVDMAPARRRLKKNTSRRKG